MKAGFPLMPKQAFLHPQNRSKMSKIVGVIAVSNEYTSKIIGQDGGICPLFGQGGL